MTIDLERGEFTLGGETVKAGDQIAIDGTTGVVTLDDVPLVEPELGEHFERVLQWCDERRRLGVRANADVGEDARAAVEMGAEGIGLCRTEHTLLTDEHKPKVAAMIMAADDEERRERLEVLLPLQREVFDELFEAMGDAAGHGPAARPAAARVPARPRRRWPRSSGTSRSASRSRDIEQTTTTSTTSRTTSPSCARFYRARRGDPRGEPDARHARLPPRDPLPRDLRDAGRGAAAGDAKRPRRHLEIMVPLVDYEHELRDDPRR